MDKNRKIKVYQVVRPYYKNRLGVIPKEQRKTITVCIGTIILPKHDVEYMNDSIWDLFNWTCWCWPDRRKAWVWAIRKGVRRDGIKCYPNSHARGFCNSDIFFFHNGKWHVALSFGWDTADSFWEARMKASKYCERF